MILKLIRLKKSERQTDGSWVSRNITLDEATWNRIRKINSNSVKYELLPDAEPAQPKELMKPKAVSTKVARPVVEEKEEEEESAEEVDYSNYTLSELRDACRNNEPPIEFSPAEKEKSLIKKLKNAGSSN